MTYKHTKVGENGLVDKTQSYPQKKQEKCEENIVIHEVIHNMHKKGPQVWNTEKVVKFESLFWDL